ncbi:MAG TPA: hypothetical protein VGH28_26305 [Polyangiaceae bacterium]|jgi:hypothetical protein
MKQEAQEPDELPLRKLLFTAFVTVAIFGAGIAGAAGALTKRHVTTVPPPHTTVRNSLIGNTAPGLDRKTTKLDAFGWADRDAGIATIPIDRAIEITLEERK